MKFCKSLYAITFCLLVFSCARQTSPTGGPKDTIPPVLVKVIPPRESTNFKGKSLELEFSEQIVAANPKEQLIITPSIGKDFQVKAKKKKAIVEFESDLLDSTTYTFNFRETIQDITEKNPARNLQIAFSTGPYIDSLSIRGKVYDLVRNKEIKEATVAIHVPSDTFSILRHPATFFTKTDTKGNFSIDHLKPGKYYIYAIDDNNKNLIADSRSEYYGFESEPITLERDTAGIQIGIIKLDARPLKISSSRPYNTYFNIRTTKSIKDFNLHALDSTELYYAFGEDRSNVRIYNTTTNSDSLAIKFTATDSIQNKIDTTLYAKFITTEVVPEKFNASLTSYSIIADKGEFNAKLSFNKPIQHINFDSLLFRADTANIIRFSSSDLIWDKKNKTVTIRKILDKKLFQIKTTEPSKTPAINDSIPKTVPNNGESSSKSNTRKKINNELLMGQGTFISVDKDSSRRISQTITPSKPEELSRIIYNIGIEETNFIIQLLDKDLNVVKQIQDKPREEFTDLAPSEYILRVIIDTNDNGEWDPGNYLRNQEPEQIHYYKDEKGNNVITLKANWDFELAPMLINPR